MRKSILTLCLFSAFSFVGQAQAKESCRIVSGYGTAIGTGETKLQAKENARLDCGTKMIDGYLALRKNLTPDAEDQIIDMCVNAECS